LLVGLTGTIGSGKSLAASLFRELGAFVIDADQIARDLVVPGKPAWQKIVDAFGDEILSPDRSLNRPALAAIVFNNEQKKKVLEDILHPEVFAEEMRVYEAIQEQEPGRVVIVDSPLVIESGNYKNMDRVVVVVADPELQIERVMKRNGLSRRDIQLRMDRQLSHDEKLKYADHRLDNDSDLEGLKQNVQALWELLNRDT
jgi:dephospho-CoA kinase